MKKGADMRAGQRRRLVEMMIVAGVTATVVAPVAVLAVGPFTDVPETHTFVADIEWMADNGITDGCGNGNFCPSDPVTRAQMSAFMHRLATFEVVDAATANLADHATNSSKLQGKTRVEIASQVAAEEDGVPFAQQETNQGQVEVNAVTVVAPKDGVLVISGTAWIDPQSTVTDFVLRTEINGQPVGSPGWSDWFRPASDAQTFELSYTVAEEVTAGTHTVTQYVGPWTGTSTYIHNHETLTVLFIPIGQATFESSSATETATIVSER